MRDLEAMEVASPEEEAMDGVPSKEEAMEVDQLQMQPLAHDFIMAKVFSKKKVKTSTPHWPGIKILREVQGCSDAP